MADNKFDLNKLKESAGGIMGSLKSMINPAGATPNVSPDDALGLKIAQLTTLVKQLSDSQQEHVKNLHKVNELLNAVFQDIEAFRAQTKACEAAKAAEAVAKSEEKKPE